MSRGAKYVHAALVVGALGCNAIAGINDPIEGTTGGSTVGVERFVGNWHNTLQSFQCPGIFDPQTTSGELDFIITSPGAGELNLQLAQRRECNIRATVSGNTATAFPGQECSFVYANGQTGFYKYLAPGTFTVSADGTTAAVEINANVTFQPANVSCTYHEESSYAKQ